MVLPAFSVQYFEKRDWLSIFFLFVPCEHRVSREGPHLEIQKTLLPHCCVVFMVCKLTRSRFLGALFADIRDALAIVVEKEYVVF